MGILHQLLDLLLSLFGRKALEIALEPGPDEELTDPTLSPPPSVLEVSPRPEDPPEEPSVKPEPPKEPMDIVSLPFDFDKKRIIKAILSVFETGTTFADYGVVTVLADGAGITYGAHQSTDGGESSLDKIVIRYIELGGVYADDLAPFLNRLENDETTSADPNAIPAWVQSLMTILERAGDSDPLMAQAQEEVFESHYWEPAAKQADGMDLKTALAWLVCYDSTIHSGSRGIGIIRRRFVEGPPSSGGDERAWVKAYLDARRQWLLTIPHAASTVYRIDSMLALLEAGNWELNAPVKIQKPRATIS